MAFLIRARLSAPDDDDDDGTSGSAASSLSSGASSRSPSPPPPLGTPRTVAAVLGAPRVAAQLSSSTDDEGDVFDDAADFGDEFLEEVTNGFFCGVARVPPPHTPSTPSDEGPISSADETPEGAGRGGSASEGSEYFGAAEEEGSSDLQGSAAGARSGLEEEEGAVVVGDKGGVGVEGSLNGSFLSSRSVLDDGEGATAGDLVNVSDGSVMKGEKQGDQDVSSQAVNDVVPEPSSIGDIVEASKGDSVWSEQEFAELPPAANSMEEEDAGKALLNDDSDMPKNEVVTYVEDASPEHVATRDAASELAELHTNVDSPHFLADGGHNKTGVGKSATINSIFGEDKSKTNAFLPATCSVKEIAGAVGGVKFRVIDTPGLGTTIKDEKSNRKVLSSVKKYIKKCPPDVVLYVDRLDTQRQGANDLSLLQCITSVLGLSIWSKVIITFTHSAADPPEGPSGSPMNYEMVVTHRTHALQQSIRQTTNDPRMENPVALVENHHLCQRNMEGEKVLPNGLIWRRLLLLLCYSLKMVAEIESFSTRHAASASLFGIRIQMPPLPYFLSSLLQSREHPRHANDRNVESVDSDVDLEELLDEDQEEEEYAYDQLPPFKPLSKSQIANLSKEQKKLYFDEYDYRTKLLQDKQFKEQRRRLKEMKKSEGNSHDAPGNNNHPDDEYGIDRSPMPDWALPSSFDSDDPVYRYRCLEPTPNLMVRAVTNPEGWDHDCGFDGVSLQHSLDVASTYPASLWFQVNKDKREFTIHLESSISAKHGEYASTLAGFDIQTMMDQLAYTLRGETKFKNIKKNAATGGLSMTFLGNTMVTGAKFEDKLSVGNRLTLVANTGAVSMNGDTAYGTNMEANLLEKDYPMGQGLATFGASVVRWHKEWTMAANLDSQFPVGRTSRMAVHVDMNNKLTGRVSIKASSSEHLKITLLGICSTAMYLWNRMHPCVDPSYE